MKTKIFTLLTKKHKTHNLGIHQQEFKFDLTLPQDEEKCQHF